MPRSKNVRIFRLVIIALLACLFAAGWLFYQYRFKRTKRPALYTEFGIYLPAGYMLHGIDVSRYQGTIDWQAVSTMNIDSVQMDFAFIRATQGTSYVDPYFEQNWREITQTRMTRGVYHYFEPAIDGEAQARHFIRTVKLQPGDLAPVLDVEELRESTPEQLVKEVRGWIELVETHYHIRPIIYTGADFYRRYLSAYFSDYPLWVAHYYQPRAPRVAAAWKFWQHNDRGRVNGIESGVDFNVFNGSRAELDSLCIPRTIP
ncbi:MAG: glycoside hydrolase family 25 protein [Bacteroidota bacterium]